MKNSKPILQLFLAVAFSTGTRLCHYFPPALLNHDHTWPRPLTKIKSYLNSVRKFLLLFINRPSQMVHVNPNQPIWPTYVAMPFACVCSLCVCACATPKCWLISYLYVNLLFIEWKNPIVSCDGQMSFVDIKKGKVCEHHELGNYHINWSISMVTTQAKLEQSM